MIVSPDSVRALAMSTALNGAGPWTVEHWSGALSDIPAEVQAVIIDRAGLEPDCSSLAMLAATRRDLLVIVALCKPCERDAVFIVSHGANDCAVIPQGHESLLVMMLHKALAQAESRRGERRADAELRAILAQLRARNESLEETVSHLEAMVMTDPLTKLANRRHVEQRLPQMFAESVRYGTDLTAMMIDLDGFKSINDTLGHGRGDDLLRMTGRIVLEHVRQSDLAARYGGDEFLILLPRTSSSLAAQVSERLINVFHRQAAMSARGGVRVGMSIGVACVSISKPLDATDLLSHADNALYAAKQGGKSRTMLCGPDGVNAVTLAA